MLAVGMAAPVWSGAGTVWALGSGATTIDDVAVLAPPPDDVVIVEAVSRLRSELGVMGMTSHLVACTDDVAIDSRACDEARAARAMSVRAVPAASRLGEPPAAASSSSSESATPSTPAAAGSSPRGRPSAIISLAREDGVVTIEVIERLPNGSRFFRLVYVPGRDGGKDPAVLTTDERDP